MDNPTQALLLKAIEDKSVMHLRICPTRSGLIRRIHQVTGMIEMIKKQPEYADLIVPLEQHYAWLEVKVKGWPI